MRLVITCVLLASATLLPGLHAHANGFRPEHRPASSAAPLTPRERGNVARQFVLKWGPYVQRVHGVDVRTWARRMVPSFVAADPTNLRDALQRRTFEGAMAALTGHGNALPDDNVVAKLNAAALTSADPVPGKALGSALEDLVYRPVTPCRIVDTRNTGEGPIAANGTRSFVALNTTYAAQGGSATDCGTTGATLAGAVALNVTAVLPNAAGFATVYPFGTAQPLASSVNYTAGAIVNNAIITRIPNPLTNSDFTIYTFAQAHYVVDIVGYFSAPQATALQCTQSSLATVDMPAGGSATVFSPACPTGYTKTGTSCDTTSTSAYLTISAIGGCQGRNTSGSVQQLSAQATCCRVPGR